MHLSKVLFVNYSVTLIFQASDSKNLNKPCHLKGYMTFESMVPPEILTFASLLSSAVKGNQSTVYLVFLTASY